MLRRWSSAWVFAFGLVALVGPEVLAQGSTGDVQGRILDSAGAAIAGATVVIVNESTSAEVQLETGVDGRFRISELPAGQYTISVRSVGRSTVEQRTIRLSAGEVQTIEVAVAATPFELEGVVVAATRTVTPLEAVPGAVSVVTRGEVEEQARLSSNLGDVLAHVVPGLGQALQSPSNDGQSLRGRGIAVLIDGVPQSTTRNVSRDLATIDPSAIERIEVLRGATAIYGDGATGGVINIVTRSAGAPGVGFSTSVGFDGALTDAGEGLGGRLRRHVTGRNGPVDFALSASIERTGSYYDAAGDMIPPDPHGQGGLADSDAWDVLGKVGLDLGGERLQLMINRYTSEQETGYVSDPALDTTEPGTRKARPISGLALAEDQGTGNTVVSLDHENGDLYGSRLQSQLYYRDYNTIFRPFDGRALRSTGFGIIQSWLESETLGGRLAVETSLGGPTLLWGADYSHETTAQPVYAFDPAVYDATDGLAFEKTGEATWVPEMNPRKLGVFAQLSWDAAEPLHLRGGVRYERARLHIDDFTTLAGTPVTGGELAFGPLLINVGAVLDATEAVSIYGSFSQGFSLADIGLFLRSPPDTLAFVVGSKSLEANTVDQYELGVRGSLGAVRATLAGFYNTSEFGTRSGGFDMTVVRAPERVYGVEATLDASPAPAWTAGGTFGWSEGEWQDQDTGSYYALNSWRIQPWKLTAYVEHETLPGWRNRVQALRSGSRDILDDRPDPASAPGFGERPVDGYNVLDLLSTIDLGRGTLHVGVHNLLNELYFPVASQLMRTGGNSSYSAARGAVLSVGYSVEY